MKYEVYENVHVSDSLLEYTFISTGPKGDIKKLIQFTPTRYAGVYNLALLNLNSDGSSDDLTVVDNKDRNKILATVAAAVYKFVKSFPDKWIFFGGNTPEKTKLYRMVITIHFDELSVDFQILGILENKASFLPVPFQKGTDYIGFLIRGKNINFIP